MSAYEGKEKYIFVSYAHKDSDTVIPTIEALQKSGFRVWYDSGIEAGTEWPAYIEEHLENCSVVLAFISPAAVASVNCRNEINLALKMKKEILIIYLEETTLIQGMNLQLNSLQSMYRHRHRHSSPKSFLEELLKARIIKCCREGYEEDGDEDKFTEDDFMKDFESDFGGGFGGSASAMTDLEMTRESRKSGPALIARVGTKGAKDVSDMWPKTPYTQVISMDEYVAVMFHCELMNQVGVKARKSIGWRVFDSTGSLVYEHSGEIDFEPSNDNFSSRWIVNSPDSIPALPGEYTVLVWYEDSRAMEYRFKLVSSSYSGLNEEHVDTETSTVQNKILKSEIKKEIEEINKKLSYSKVFWAGIRCSLVGLFALIFLSVANESYDSTAIIMNLIIALVLAVISIVLFVKFFKKTKEFIASNTIVALILTIAVSGYYMFFLFVMAVIYHFQKKTLLTRLAQLEMLQ